MTGDVQWSSAFASTSRRRLPRKEEEDALSYLRWDYFGLKFSSLDRGGLSRG